MSIMDILLEVLPRTHSYMEAVKNTVPKTPYRETAVKNFLEYLYSIIPESKRYIRLKKDIKGNIQIRMTDNAIRRLQNDILKSDDSIANILSNYYINISYNNFIGVKIYSLQSSERYQDKIGMVKLGLFSCHDKNISKLILKDVKTLYNKYI